MEICMQEESNKVLIPGKVDERRFWLLIELSPFRSEKIVRALRDFLVMGYNRKEVCVKNMEHRTVIFR